MKYFLLAILFCSIFSCSESLPEISNDRTYEIESRRDCIPTITTEVEGCCIKADAFPAFPGQESSIDFGDGTIIILDKSSSTEHCYDEAGTYIVISTLRDSEGNILEQRCERFIVNCEICCDSVSIEFEEVASDNTVCCFYKIIVKNPTNCSFTLTVPVPGTPDQYNIPANSEIEIEELLRVCSVPKTLELVSNNPNDNCTKTFQSPNCNPCCKEIKENIQISYCVHKEISTECCFIKFEFVNTSECTIYVLDANNASIGYEIFPGESFYRILNTCDIHDYYLSSEMGGTRCLSIDLPSCTDEIESCN